MKIQHRIANSLSKILGETQRHLQTLDARVECVDPLGHEEAIKTFNRVLMDLARVHKDFDLRLTHTESDMGEIKDATILREKIADATAKFLKDLALVYTLDENPGPADSSAETESSAEQALITPTDLLELEGE